MTAQPATSLTPTPQEEAYIRRLGRALRCGKPDCGCAPVPAERLHCPVHRNPYVPTLRASYEPGFGFSFVCSSGCPSYKIEEALARRGLPPASALQTATGALAAGLSPYELLISQPSDWLWPNRIPMGELTVVAGYPASGKTAVALDIAARVSLGADTPDQPGAAFVRAPVVIVAPLRNPRASLLPRLRDLGADLSLVYHADVLAPVHLVDFAEEDGVEDLETVSESARLHDRYEQAPTLLDPDAPPPPPPTPQEPPRGPSLPVVMNRLANFITRGSAALLVVDQIEHLALIHNVRVARVAGMLNALAASTGAAVLALVHNPAHSLEAAARYMQPRLGMAGAVYTIALVGEERARFLIPLSPPMHDALPPIPFNFHEAPPIAWRDPIPYERLLALGNPRPPRRFDWTAYASRFLTDALAHGSRPAAELAERAAAMGISKHHLYRARAACNVTTTRIGGRSDSGGPAYWLCSLQRHDTRAPAPDLGSSGQDQGNGLLRRSSEDQNDPAFYEYRSDQETEEQRTDDDRTDLAPSECGDEVRAYNPAQTV